jgi:hypothetical protein
MEGLVTPPDIFFCWLAHRRPVAKSGYPFYLSFMPAHKEFRDARGEGNNTTGVVINAVYLRRFRL